VHVQDLEHFTRFMMERLLKLTSVIDVKSTFVLESLKDTTALPLAHLK
jgi:Lrp/AsnC family leucine-responsive transcriptional regulator